MNELCSKESRVFNCFSRQRETKIASQELMVNGRLVTFEQRQSILPDGHGGRSRALSIHLMWGRTGKALWLNLNVDSLDFV